MDVYCVILGFRIDPERVCGAKFGNHRECRKCSASKVGLPPVEDKKRSSEVQAESNFIDLKVITPAGKRVKGKTPGFLATKEFTCPRCGQKEYGNTSLEKVKGCSYCNMGISPDQEEPPPVDPQRVISITPEIKRLVALECANYITFGPFKTQNFCWMCSTRTCAYFSPLRNPRCEYFEKSALPLKPELEEDYFKTPEGKNGRPDFHGETVHGGLGDSTARYRGDEESRLAFRPGGKGKAALSSLGNPRLGQKKVGLGNR